MQNSVESVTCSLLCPFLWVQDPLYIQAKHVLQFCKLMPEIAGINSKISIRPQDGLGESIYIYIDISLKFHIYVTIYSIICTTSQPFHEMSPIITMAAKERVKEQITEQIALENLLESQGGVQVPRMPGISEMFLLVKCRSKGCEM